MNKRIAGVSLAAMLLSGGVIGLALTQPPAPAQPPREAEEENEEGEQERSVIEAEVPKAALDALKKVAGGAKFTEFAEEIEHGHKFYEGSWNGATGNVDALVTESGDLVEIEERISADSVPAATRAAMEKAAGKDSKATFERKTLILYEIHWTKDGKGHEMILTPDGRHYDEHGAMGGNKGRNEEEGEDH